MSKDDIKPKKSQKQNNWSMDLFLSYVALALLAAFAYIGIKSLVIADPVYQIGLAIIVVGLLIKTALKK